MARFHHKFYLDIEVYKNKLAKSEIENIIKELSKHYPEIKESLTIKNEYLTFSFESDLRYHSPKANNHLFWFIQTLTVYVEHEQYSLTTIDSITLDTEIRGDYKNFTKVINTEDFDLEFEDGKDVKKDIDSFNLEKNKWGYLGYFDKELQMEKSIKVNMRRIKQKILNRDKKAFVALNLEKGYIYASSKKAMRSYFNEIHFFLYGMECIGFRKCKGILDIWRSNDYQNKEEKSIFKLKIDFKPIEKTL